MENNQAPKRRMKRSDILLPLVIMLGGIAAVFGLPVDSAAQQLLSFNPAEIDSNA
ncbi:MAG: hypothetical protein IIB41_04695, partial [Candidatus Marinimicrobia bacterium]|nr:hypothetical protein [Candidatus Neomarinimicrobiota bacterium]